MALNNFNPSTYGEMVLGTYTSSTQALPGGGGPTLQVTNLGQAPAVVLLGGVSVVVTETTGLVIPAGGSVPLAVGSNTYIAGMALGIMAKLCLAQGT